MENYTVFFLNTGKFDMVILKRAEISSKFNRTNTTPDKKSFLQSYLHIQKK